MAGSSPGSSSSVGVVLMVVLGLAGGTAVLAFTGQLAGDLRDPAPRVTVDVEVERVGDGVPKNDAVTVTHLRGAQLERRKLEVRIGDDVVYNRTSDSESQGTVSVPGLVLEVDDDEFNDLNKPCRLAPGDCTPADPPGDGDGADPSVVFEWESTVTAGQRLTIQERNHPNSYDVVQPGDEVRVIYRTERFAAVLARTTV